MGPFPPSIPSPWRWQQFTPKRRNSFKIHRDWISLVLVQTTLHRSLFLFLLVSFMVYLTTLSVAGTVKCRAVGRLVNLTEEDVVGSGSVVLRGIILKVTSVRISSLRAEYEAWVLLLTVTFVFFFCVLKKVRSSETICIDLGTVETHAWAMFPRVPKENRATRICQSVCLAIPGVTYRHKHYL
jgi:hypothetical protein